MLHFTLDITRYLEGEFQETSPNLKELDEGTVMGL